MKRLLPLALLVLSGCAMSASPMVKSCTQDSDCPGDQTCFEDGCGSALDFSARVTPLNSSGFVVQDFGWVGVGRSNTIELSMRPAATVEGALRIRKSGSTTDYSAGPFTIEARGTSSIIPGLPFQTPITQTVKTGANYSLAVPAGLWDITARCDDLTLPPIFAQRALSSGDVADPGLVLPGDNLLAISGNLVRTADIPWDTAAPTFRFQVFDSSTQTAISQAPVFLATDAFQVFALKGTNAVTLRVSPIGDAAATTPSKDFLSDSTGHFPDGFALGDYGSLVQVTGSVEDSFGNPVPETQIELRGTVRGGGTFAATAKTDSSGNYSAQVLPSEDAYGSMATYVVAAHPPTQSSFATSAIKVAISETNTALPAIVCPPKNLLTGQIKSSDGTALSNVLVQYEGNTAAADPGASKGDVQTDSAGRYRVLVEPGSYRLIAKPGADKRLPWGARRVSVQSDTTLDITLSQPREVYGTVKSKNADGTNSSVANAIVAIYRVQQTWGGEPATPLLIYEALSDSMGQFKLIVPEAGGN